jgi:pilus assembly protein FimV
MQRSFLFIARLILLMSLSFGAQALTLAGIEVKSLKGEPLKAEVTVLNASAEEWGQLVVKVASPERFSQLGLVYTPAVGQLQIELFETKEGNQRILLSSPQSFSDNFVDLLLEAQTASSKWVKAFTLMLKAPQTKVESPLQLATAPATTATPQSTTPPAEHVVQKGESASQIIQKWLTQDMSTQQMLVALLKNQPDAFIEGNVNLLRAGAVLKAPTPTAVRAIDPDEARQFLVVQQKEFIAYSQAASQNTQQVKGQTPSKQIVGKVGQEAPAPQNPEQSIDQLRLTQAKIEKQNEETRIAAQRALQDAQKQLDALQNNVDQLVHLTSPNNQTVANAAKQKAATVDAGSGWLNLNRLLESPHQSSFLWGALALLGILLLGAGLRIQTRKSSSNLSTLTPAARQPETQVVKGSASPLELPPEIAALNLDLNPQNNNLGGSFQSPASTKTIQ